MLFGENGGGNQNGYLEAFHHRLESRAESHLGFAVTDVAADQPVHGF